MKIYFGFDNSRDLKISSSVADKGLNLLKCKPIAFPMFGLRSIVQPGYDTYINCLPSFMKATEKNTKIALSAIGNGTKLPMDKCMPIELPKVFLMIKKSDRIDKVIGSDKRYAELFTRKEGTAYSTDFSKDLLRIGTHTSVLENTFPVDRHIKPNDAIVVVRVLQMLSSLLLTHKYPAFQDDDATAAQAKPMERETLSYKRTADAANRLEKRKMVRIEGTEYGTFHAFYKDDILSSLNIKVEFKKAKPTTSTTPAWGTTSELPQTQGIHFPYDEDLAQPDGDTVPLLIERYLLPCLHDNPESSVAIFSDVVQAWKSTIHRTPFGYEMTHLAKVFLTALPSQARVFPIIHDKAYLGCYLSGSHFSVGIKGIVYKPDSYENNTKELDCYCSNDQVLKRIAVLCSSDKNSQKKIIDVGPHIRKLANHIHKTLTISLETREKIITLASTLRQQEPYKKVNASNLNWAINLLVSSVLPAPDQPMSPHSMFSINDHFECVMSAFGSHIPSPEIPSALKWKIDAAKVPDKMTGIFAFRLCSMEEAKSDWLKIRETKVLHNCPERISAIYEHTVVRGKEDRESVWASLYAWTSSSDDTRDRAAAGLGKVVESAGEGGVSVAADLFEDTGF